MMDFEISASGPLSHIEIEEMTAHCMRWTKEKYAIAQAINGRLLVRKKTPADKFCCPNCFHPEQVFEFRIAMPIEAIPKGQGWMMIEDRPDGMSNRSVDG